MRDQRSPYASGWFGGPEVEYRVTARPTRMPWVMIGPEVDAGGPLEVLARSCIAALVRRLCGAPYVTEVREKRKGGRVRKVYESATYWEFCDAQKQAFWIEDMLRGSSRLDGQ